MIQFVDRVSYRNKTTIGEDGQEVFLLEDWVKFYKILSVNDMNEIITEVFTIYQLPLRFFDFSVRLTSRVFPINNEILKDIQLMVKYATLLG